MPGGNFSNHFLYICLLVVGLCYVDLLNSNQLFGATMKETKGLMKYNGKTYPVEVDLSTQLTRPNKLQVGGTCHVHAAVDLFEAACYRATGEHVNLSEAYLSYRHLRNRLNKTIGTNLIGKTIKPRFLTSRDGGWGGNTLDRILNHSVCTEEETEDPKEFYAFVRKAFRKAKERAEEKAKEISPSGIGSAIGGVGGGGLGAGIGIPVYLLLKEENKLDGVSPSCWRTLTNLGMASLPSLAVGSLGAVMGHLVEPAVQETAIEGPCLDEFCKEMDKKAKEVFNLNDRPQNSPGLMRATEDSIVKKCLEKGLKYWEGPATHPTMIELLSKGIPFICTGKYDFGNGNSGRHEAIVVGYRVDPDSPGGFEYLIRNADGRAPSFWSIRKEGCRKIISLQ